MRSSILRLLWWLNLVFVFFPLLSFVFAQDTVTGAFEGTVTDSQTGEPLANAQVVITNQATNLARSKTANAQGRFYQGLLSPGIYTIRVSASGYETREVEQRLLVTRTGEVVPVPVALDPATAAPVAAPTPAATPLTAQQTQVRAETNRSDAQRAGSFPDGTVDALPLGGATLTRSFDELTLLLPGVTMPPPTLGRGAGPGQGAGVGSAGQFSINGLRSRGNNFTVDGSDNNDEDIGVRRQGFVSLVPQSIESIREYQATVLLPSAVFGRNLGGQINAVSRSGGNQFHGNLYGFFNASQLNARNFFDTANGNGVSPVTVGNQAVIIAPRVDYNNATSKFVAVNGSPLTTQNGSGGQDSFTLGQGGFVLGGPLRRDKAFFFVSAERQIINALQEANFAVPTVAQRGLGNSGATGIFRNLFFGDIVPFGAQPNTLQGDAIFSLYPFPNNPAGVYGANTLTQTLPASGEGTVASAKYDQNFTLGERLQTLTARYNFTQDRRILPVTGGALFSALQPRVRAQNFSFFYNGEVNNPSASTQIFNQLRLSYGRTRLVFDEVSDRSGHAVRSSGLPNTPFLLNARLIENFTLPDIGRDALLPNTGPVILQRRPGATAEQPLGPVGQVNIAGFSPVGVDVYNFPQSRVNNTYQVADNLTFRFAKHTLVVGYDGRRSELNSDLQRNFRPLISFNGSPQIIGSPSCYSQAFPRPPCTIGDFTGRFTQPLFLAAGSIPTGVTQSLTNGADAALNLRFYQHNAFVQDDWRVLPNLSFSLGLRYEMNTPFSDGQRRVEGSFNDPNLGLVPGLAPFIGGRARPFEPDLDNFGPRLALAYSQGNTVVRAGYGLFYDQILGAVVSQSRTVFPRFLNVNTAGASGTPFGGTQIPFSILNPALNRALVAPGTLNRLPPGMPLAGQVQQVNFIAGSGGFLPGASGIEVTLPARDLKTPYSQQFTFGVEQALKPNFSVSAAYVGTSGGALLQFSTPNLGSNAILLPFLFGTSQTETNLEFRPQIFGFALPPGARFSPNTTTVTGGRPSSGIGGVSQFNTTGDSFYHSLQLQARGRVADALQFQASYTLSRVNDDVSDVFDLAGAFALPQNSMTREGEYAPANFDARHRFAYYFIYDAPFSGYTGLARALLKDLQISGTGQFQTGAPFTVNSIFDINLDGNLTDRLNRADGLIVTGDRRQPLRLTVDPSMLVAPVGQDGAVRRNSFRAGSLLDLNLAFSKGVRFNERRRILLRAEIFNFINRANYGIPVRFLEAPGFGQATDTLTPGRRAQFALKYMF
jgi:hypothetical protein